MPQRLADHTNDSHRKGAKNTPESVLHMVIDCKHVVENNGRDPTVLTMLHMYERKLYGMMRAAKVHGNAAVHGDILSEAIAYVAMQGERAQILGEPEAPTDTTATEIAHPSTATQKRREENRAKWLAQLKGGLER